MTDFAKLAAPFPPAAVSWRIGSTTADKTRGMALAYLDARDVMDRLDEVCGADGWQATYPHAGQKTVCSIGILSGEHWVWKSNGAGDSDIEAEKGALSDAFKRAAVLWGIGRYLYHLKSPWVEIETKGKTSIIKEHEHARLAALLAKHSGPIRPAPEPPPPPPSRVDPLDQALVQGDGRTTYQLATAEKSPGRQAAELWVSQAVKLFKMPGYNLLHFREWKETPCTPQGRKNNGEKLGELREKHPDLAQAIDDATSDLQPAILLGAA